MAMSVVLFRCPTGKSIDVGIESDEKSVASMGGESLDVDCPHCGERHSFLTKEARLRDHRLAK